MNLSIIITLFNVEQYINRLAESLNANKLNDDVEIIIINDGSTDRSFLLNNLLDHNNVIYIETKNKGVHHARNIGLKQACGTWITFIDGDDYVSDDYFSLIDYEAKCDVINNKMDIYLQIKDEIVDHPLNYKFLDKKVVNINKNYEYFNLSVANLLLRREIIESNNLLFKPTIISFEDASFYIEYLNCCRGDILLNPQSIYYYRKRISNNSTIDTHQNNIIKYTTFIQEVYIKKLILHNNNFVQAMVLYDLWNNMLSYTNYGVDLKDSRMNVVKELLNLISNDVINSLAKCFDKTYIDYVKCLKFDKKILKVTNIKYREYQIITTQVLNSNKHFLVKDARIIYNEFTKLYLYNITTNKNILVIGKKRYFIKSFKNNLLHE